MGASPYVRRYQEAQTQERTPEELLLMLVDCALTRAEQAGAAEDPDSRRVALEKLRRIVAELVDTLDVDVGGKVAVDLMRGYLGLLREVARAHADGEPAALAEVLRRTRDMHEMWHAAVEKALSEREG